MRRARDSSPVRVPTLELVEDPGSIAETAQIVHRKLGLMFERLEQKGFAPIIEEVLARTTGRTREGLELGIAKQIWQNFDTELLHMDDPRFALVAMRTVQWAGVYNTAWLVHEAFPEYAASLSVRVETALRLDSKRSCDRDTYRFFETVARQVGPANDTSLEALRARWKAHNDLGERFHDNGAFGNTKMYARFFAIGDRLTDLDFQPKAPITLWDRLRNYCYERDFMPETRVQVLGAALACLHSEGNSGKHTLWWLKAAREQLGNVVRLEWFASLKMVFDQLSSYRAVSAIFVQALLEKGTDELIEIIAHSPTRDGYFTLRY